MPAIRHSPNWISSYRIWPGTVRGHCRMPRAFWTRKRTSEVGKMMSCVVQGRKERLVWLIYQVYRVVRYPLKKQTYPRPKNHLPRRHPIFPRLLSMPITILANFLRILPPRLPSCNNRMPSYLRAYTSKAFRLS